MGFLFGRRFFVVVVGFFVVVVVCCFFGRCGGWGGRLFVWLLFSQRELPPINKFTT